MVISAWPDANAATSLAGRALAGCADIVETALDLLEPTVRPTESTPPDRPGVYAFRTFELAEKDWPTFRVLSSA